MLLYVKSFTGHYIYTFYRLGMHAVDMGVAVRSCVSSDVESRQAAEAGSEVQSSRHGWTGFSSIKAGAWCVGDLSSLPTIEYGEKATDQCMHSRVSTSDHTASRENW